MKTTCKIYPATPMIGVAYEHCKPEVSEDASKTLKLLLARPTLIGGIPMYATHVTELSPCRISIWQLRILSRSVRGFLAAQKLYRFEVYYSEEDDAEGTYSWPEFWEVVRAINVGRVYAGKDASEIYKDALVIGEQRSLL